MRNEECVITFHLSIFPPFHLSTFPSFFGGNFFLNKAVFFDRDGVLNEEIGYLFEVEKFKWTLGAIDSLCNEKNFLVIVVTNQSGVARNFYAEDDVKKIHDFMQNDLKNFGAHIDAFYYCPHHPEGVVEKYKKVCNCRKPKPGMILQAAKDFDIDLKQSILFGDSQRDIDAAKNAGLKAGIFFSGGNLFDLVKTQI